MAFDFTGTAYVANPSAEVESLGVRASDYAVTELNLKTGRQTVKQTWLRESEDPPLNALDALLKHLVREGKPRKVASIMRKGDEYLVIMTGQAIVYAKAVVFPE